MHIHVVMFVGGTLLLQLLAASTQTCLVVLEVMYICAAPVCVSAIASVIDTCICIVQNSSRSCLVSLASRSARQLTGTAVDQGPAPATARCVFHKRVFTTLLCHICICCLFQEGPSKQYSAGTPSAASTDITATPGLPHAASCFFSFQA